MPHFEEISQENKLYQKDWKAYRNYFEDFIVITSNKNSLRPIV